MSELSAEDKKGIAQLRSECAEWLTPTYDTDLNLHRWWQEYADSKQLIEHLKLRLRKLYDLDNYLNMPEHPAQAYYPSAIIGGTGVDNRMVMIECPGITDQTGLMKTASFHGAVLQGLKTHERLLRMVMEQEKTDAKQSSVILILDQSGLEMHPSLLGTVTNQFRLSMSAMMSNYPGLISTIITINAPSFVSTLWAALKKLTPQHIIDKVSIYADEDEWKPKLLELIDAECLPVKWGGKLTGADGSPSGPVQIPPGPVPESLFWQGSDEKPLPDQLSSMNVDPGYVNVLSYVLHHDDITHIQINTFTDFDQTYTLCIYYHSLAQLTASGDDVCELALEDAVVWLPSQEHASTYVTDCRRIPLNGPGVYHLKLGNETAWLRAMNVQYKVQWVHKDGKLSTMDYTLNEPFAEHILDAADNE